MAYGEYLCEKRRYEEAAILFSLAEEHEQALSAYESCNNWRMVTCVAAKLQYTPDQMSQLARRVAGKLEG